MDVVASFASRLYPILFAAEVLLITLLAKKADDWRTSAFNDDELISAGNVAVGVRRAGLFLGGMVAMAGVLSGSSRGLGADLVTVAVFGVAAYAALFVARAVCDRAILRGMRDDVECAKGNVAVGLVEFGIFVATGLLLNGSLSGDDPDLARGMVSFVMFFVLGQIVFVVLAVVFARLTPFDDRKELARGNRAVGAEFAGLFVAIALVLRAGLLGPSQGLAADIVEFFVSVVVGAVLLLLFQWLIRPVFLPRTRLSASLAGDNLAAALALQALTLAFALLLATTVV
jgi:uncharacterized membrane protein YjfL (UPF0719 family)